MKARGLLTGFFLAFVPYPQRDWRTLPIGLGVVHLLSAEWQDRELPGSNGLRYVGEVIVPGRQVLGIETHRLVAQLFVVKTPARITKGVPIGISEPERLLGVQHYGLVGIDLGRGGEVAIHWL
jgi:hypothetical protein